MKNRRICFEFLEERTLLAVTAGGFEQLAALPEPAGATDWIVNTLDDAATWDETDDIISLREAIGRAQTGDTITFDDSLAGGIIKLNGEDLFVNEGITIDASAIGGITIYAYDQSRVFYISGWDYSVQLIGLTITGGYTSGQGGGIYNLATLTLTNCTVFGNAVSEDDLGFAYGGGIYNEGELTLTNCTVVGNAASGSGGGIYNISTLTLTNTILCFNYVNGYQDNYPGQFSGRNNLINVDPGFVTAPVLKYGILVNADELDLSLTPESIAIDNGTNDAVETETDLAGNPRIFAAWRDPATVDIGAYEYQEHVEKEDILPTVVTTKRDVINITDGLISLREAIFNTAETNEAVTFDASLAGETIILGGTPLEITSGITIDASSIGGMTIDAASQSRVFHVNGGDTENPVELISLTITGGADGGINNEGNLILTNCTISGNTADREGGGGIYNYRGTLTLTNCTVSGNKGGSADGGGIANDYNSTLTLTDSTVSGNKGGSAGGIYNRGRLTLTNSTVSKNTGRHNGGGIYNSSGTLTLTNATVSRNSANENGGGIYNYDGRLTLTGCTVSGNAAYYGGGIYNRGRLTLTNSTISGNTYDGISNKYDSTLTLTNCTVSGNSGGISNEYGSTLTLTLTNCTVSGNDDYGIYNPGYGRLTLYDTIIAQNTACDIDRSDSNSLYAYNTLSSFTDWTGSGYCPVYDPDKPLFTDPANGDYTLAENSQAINKGNNDYVTTETDLAGNPRIVGGIVDLGAYEYQGGNPAEQLSAPVISTGNFGVYVSYGANRHQIQWTAVSNASGYELAYAADGSSWTTVSTAGTAAVVTGLTYGQNVRYRVRALGTGPYTDSDWSEIKTFNVCPMDINGDGDIAGGDRTIVANAWLAEEGDEGYQYYADINGDGEVSNTDRPFIGQNWNKEAGDDDLVYPRPLAADTVFAAYESGDLGVDCGVF